MSDEPGYTREQFVPSPRDELFQRARIGEFTPKEAEAEAARMGMEPLASHPKDDEFDPRKKSRWHLSMALAWILWRDFAEVREWDNDFRAECWNWQPFNVRLPTDGGTGPAGPVVRGFAVAQLHPTNSLLFEIHGAVAVLTNGLSVPGGSPRAAKADLWMALSDGRLTAEGIPATGGARIDVPAREWTDLENVTDGRLDGEYFRYRHHPLGRAYNDIVWRREDLVRLWPEVSGPPAKVDVRPARRAGTSADVEAYRVWVDTLLASGASPPTRDASERWAASRSIGVTWARSQHTALPDDKKLARGETPTRRRPNRQ
jgi:hypothetical protein